jgi:hypothetical protein
LHCASLANHFALPEWIPYSGGKQNKLELHDPQMCTAYALLSHPKPTNQIMYCHYNSIQTLFFLKMQPFETQTSFQANPDQKVYNIQQIIPIHLLLNYKQV